MKQKDNNRKIPGTNNEALVLTGSLIQLALFQGILTTNHKVFVRTSTGTEDSSLK